MPRCAGIQVEGVSIAGLETCIDLPELRLAFDLGRAYDWVLARPTLCFTHPHMDHLGAVAWHCSTRAMRKLAPPTYFMGHEWVAAFDALMVAWRALDRSELPHQRIAIGPGESYALSPELSLRPFRSHHRVACQGYGLWRRRHSLKPEFRDLAAHELARLRKEHGATYLERSTEELELAFTGDTRIEVLESSPELLQAKLLVLECSFIDERVSVERAREMGHVHLDEIAQRAALFQNQALLLTHFSERYSSGQIRSALREKLGADLWERTTPLLEGRRS